jgi:hypothetical protein
VASALAAAFTPDAGAAASDSISPNMANDRLRDHDYDANMASLGGRLSRFEQIFSEVRESIGTIRAESASLVVLNMNTCDVVGESIKDFIRAMENTNKKNAVALEEYERRIFDMTAVHTKNLGDMQAKLQGSFDRMKYLEKRFRMFRDSLQCTWRTGYWPSLPTLLRRHLPRLSQRC